MKLTIERIMKIRGIEEEEAGRLMDAAAESFDCAEGWEEGWSDCDIINFWN